ncbi:MAG TPA: cupin domain-containing protein [Rhodoglobus sp.]|jgi:uncharacterized cupin superfamily protein|nr:cupin domain-containing protein [Rhodoglobus sp.]
MSDAPLDLTALEVLTEPVAASRTVAGAPRDGAAELTVFEGCEIGVWEMTPGTATDVEVDEVFVVLAGAATITFDDGTVVDLKPGSFCHLRAGQRTRWHVTATLRKMYVVAAEGTA